MRSLAIWWPKKERRQRRWNAQVAWSASGREPQGSVLVDVNSSQRGLTVLSLITSKTRIFLENSHSLSCFVRSKSDLLCVFKLSLLFGLNDWLTGWLTRASDWVCERVVYLGRRAGWLLDHLDALFIGWLMDSQADKLLDLIRDFLAVKWSIDLVFVTK